MAKKRLPVRIRPFPESYSEDNVSFKEGCLTTLVVFIAIIIFITISTATSKS